ncbi:diaminobutyrate acetyltransferase [Hahella ganghwensis]|uniref:diaminobutyrate acetyltransferase n=1 Tax=Hahella ganghwensis TaxID=286420 RepID=UPI00037A0BB8|nr:diaminobutyrate acetyltransferase [Hahella ganghwensis]
MTKTKSDESDIKFRHPTSTDGLTVNQLIGRCPPLDTNSVYCNLLQCSHWSGTSVCAEIDNQVMGFISGYRVPDKPDHLFVWQVAVDAEARGKGLAGRMLRELIRRPGSEDIRFMQTTINPDNQASWALFESLAAELNASTKRECLFGRETHFGGRHDDEIMLTIGPF